jgi:hypothetical protein
MPLEVNVKFPASKSLDGNQLSQFGGLDLPNLRLTHALFLVLIFMSA